MKNKKNKPEAESMRPKAIELLKFKLLASNSQLNKSDVTILIHELEVHQIELEMQNAELMRARSIAQDVSLKYTELYDFSPAGYFTLSKEGTIIELNRSGKTILGKENPLLQNSRFGFFVSDNTKPIFNQFLAKVFKSKTKQT